MKYTKKPEGILFTQKEKKTYRNFPKENEHIGFTRDFKSVISTLFK